MADGGQYYLSLLTDKQKMAYGAVLSGVRQYDAEIRVTNVSGNEISEVFNYVLLDNPMIFYISSFGVSGGLFGAGCSVIPQYKYSKQFSTENAAAVKNYLRVFDAIKDKSDEIREAYVHDYCLDHFSYDFAFTEYAFSVLGPVINKTAVCEGIAKFVKLAFDYVGLKSLVVNGTANSPLHGKMEPHAWNIVMINGKTYHLDVTFDMTLTKSKNKSTSKRYDYHNLSDEDIKKDHVINGTVPACTTVGGDYFSVNSLVMNNPQEFENHAAKVLQQGKRNILVKLMNVQDTGNITGKLAAIAQRQYANVYKSGSAIEAGFNPHQRVLEINFI